MKLSNLSVLYGLTVQNVRGNQIVFEWNNKYKARRPSPVQNSRESKMYMNGTTNTKQDAYPQFKKKKIVINEF